MTRDAIESGFWTWRAIQPAMIGTTSTPYSGNWSRWKCPVSTQLAVQDVSERQER